MDSISWFELKPCDAWFFRDGRPMNRGEDARGVSSLFPPTPSTLVGAIRAALARSRGWNGYGDWKSEWKEVLGDGYDNIGRLSFTGPLLARDGMPVFPCPRHLLVDRGTFAPSDWLQPSSETVTCDLGAIHLPLPPRRDPESAALGDASNLYLSFPGIQNVIRGELPSRKEIVKADELYTFESRVGIARTEETRTVEEGALFNPTFVRLKKRASLLFGLSGLPKSWALPSLFPFGGESRMTHCRSMDSNPLQGLEKGADGTLLISICPVLPCSEIWHGPKPGETGQALHQSLRATVKTVTVDRPLKIPSWDGNRGHPLTQRNAVPAGTVWWLESPDTHGHRGGIWRLGDRCQHGYGLSVSALLPKQNRKHKE